MEKVSQNQKAVSVEREVSSLSAMLDTTEQLVGSLDAVLTSILRQQNPTEGAQDCEDRAQSSPLQWALANQNERLASINHRLNSLISRIDL